MLSRFLIASIFVLIHTPLLAKQDACNNFFHQHDELTIAANWSEAFRSASLHIDQEHLPSDVDFVEGFYLDIVTQAFLDLYLESGDLIYLDFAIYQANTDRRNQIISSLSNEEVSVLSSTLAKYLADLNLSVSYDISDFSVCHIHLFDSYEIDTNRHSEVVKLLEHWTQNLDQAFSLDPLWGNLKARTIITGYYRLNDFQKVHTLGRNFLHSNKLPPSYDTLFFLNYIAFSSTVSGYYREALRMYNEQIIPLAQELGDVTELLNARMGYAGVLFRLGNVSLAKQEYEAVYEQEEFLVDSRYRTALFNNLAITYLNSGSFDRYIEFQLEAYNIAVEGEKLQYQLSILRNLHIFYRRNRNPELAFNYISEALELATRYGLRSEIPSILISMGVHTRESLGRYDQALEFLNEATLISEEINRYLDNIQSLIETARTYSRLNNFELASSYFVETLAISEQREDVVRAASTAFRLADLYVEQGLYDEARELSSRYASVSPEMLPFNIAVTAENVKHKLLLEQGLTNDALDSSRYLIAEIRAWLRESADSQTGHMRLDPELSEAFRIHYNMLYEKGLYADLVSINEQFRSISRSAFFNNPLLKSTILNEEELLLDFALGNRIQRLRRQLAEAEGAERIEVSNDLLNAVNRRSQLLDRISPFVPDNQQNFELAGVQRTLGRGELILYFSIQNEEVFQTHITRRNVESVRHDDSARLYQLIRDAQLSFGPGTTDLNKLHEIYRIVFANLNPEDYSHIYIVPDGSFYQIPFEILPVATPNSANSFGSTTFLLENVSISYLNMANDLITKPRQRQSDFTYGYAGFGLSDFTTEGHQTLSNLPFAPREISKSASSLQKIQPAITFLNEESTRSKFYELAGNSRILHLATHSIVENEDPLFSALYLHQAVSDAENGNQTSDDGIVRAYNLFDIDLSADLVVLSSCESAQGEYLAGSGILGLSRAFSYAGAQSLLMNLWPVKDQTASQITSQFFANLDSGSDKAKSLRKARLNYLNTVNSDPFLWGGYVIHGNIAAVHSETGFFKLKVVSLSILGLLVMIQLAKVKLRRNSSA